MEKIPILPILQSSPPLCLLSFLDFQTPLLVLPMGYRSCSSHLPFRGLEKLVKKTGQNEWDLEVINVNDKLLMKRALWLQQLTKSREWTQKPDDSTCFWRHSISVVSVSIDSINDSVLVMVFYCFVPFVFFLR